MGGGSWSSSDYDRSARGADAFRVSRDTMAKPVDERKADSILDPRGLRVRESRDSAEHPESNAIIVGLDVTGSMSGVVVAIQSSLGNLMTMLLGDNYLSDPQLMFCAVGDAYRDQIPLQVSQFESDIRINEQLSRVVLERGGGGNDHESYDLLFWIADKHTDIDCLEKRGRKGYLFSIGDEMIFPEVKRNQLERIIGTAPETDVPTKDVIRRAQEKYHTFHIFPVGSYHAGNLAFRRAWVNALGADECVMLLDIPNAAAELIAVTIGLNEGVVSLNDALARVSELSGDEVAQAVRKAVEPLAKYLAKNPPSKQARRVAPKKPKTGVKKDWQL